MKTFNSYQEAADYLSEKRPGWEHFIDLERLDMDSRENCILAQLSGSYGQGCAEFGIKNQLRGVFDSWFSEELGGFFNRINMTAQEALYIHNENWKKLILSRRNPVS